MFKISYYISDHGFGHASRSIAIIRQLLKLNKHIMIYINTSIPLNFIKGSLKEYKDRLVFREVKNDVGLILRSNNLNPDYERLSNELKKLVSKWDNYISNEINYYEKNPVDLIISDITPQVFIVANRLEIESIGISNFTWYSMYEEKIDSQLLNRFKEAYAYCNYFYGLEFEQEKLKFRNKKHFGIFCREIDLNEVKRIKNMVPNNSLIVYLALGKSVDLKLLNRFKLKDSKKIYYLVSEGSPLEGENIIKIPENYTETQNYTAACDLVITKAGWSTLSECMIGNVPFIVIRRDEVNEDRNTVSSLEAKYKGFYKIISQEKVYDLNINKIIDEALAKMKCSYNNYCFNNKVELDCIVNSISSVLYKTKGVQV